MSRKSPKPTPEPPRVTGPCEVCKVGGLIGRDVHPFNVAPKVTLWAHRHCRPAYGESVNGS